MGSFIESRSQRANLSLLFLKLHFELSFSSIIFHFFLKIVVVSGLDFFVSKILHGPFSECVKKDIPKRSISIIEWHIVVLVYHYYRFNIVFTLPLDAIIVIIWPQETSIFFLIFLVFLEKHLPFYYLY